MKRYLATFTAGVVFAAVLMGPVGAHLGNPLHLWNSHLYDLARKTFAHEEEVERTYLKKNDRWFARVAGNGSLETGERSGADPLATQRISTGNYKVVFDTPPSLDLQDCAWVASTQNAAHIASTYAWNDNQIRVQTLNASDGDQDPVAADADFSLIAIC